MSEEIPEDTCARRLMAYSFLVVFANDATIDEAEFDALKRMALEDGQIDQHEKQVLANLFSRVSKETVADKVWDKMVHFREKYDIA